MPHFWPCHPDKLVFQATLLHIQVSRTDDKLDVSLPLRLDQQDAADIGMRRLLAASMTSWLDLVVNVAFV